MSCVKNEKQETCFTVKNCSEMFPLIIIAKKYYSQDFSPSNSLRRWNFVSVWCFIKILNTEPIKIQGETPENSFKGNLSTEYYWFLLYLFYKPKYTLIPYCFQQVLTFVAYQLFWVLSGTYFGITLSKWPVNWTPLSPG